MRLRTLLVFALLLFCFNSAVAAQSTGDQRTKIAIVGLVHSHCWGFVTKLNQMHQNRDLIEIVGVSDDNQELRDYVKTLVPGVPIYDNYSKLLDEKKPRRPAPSAKFTSCLKSPCRRPMTRLAR
jgi:hypothetical protein